MHLHSNADKFKSWIIFPPDEDVQPFYLWNVESLKLLKDICFKETLWLFGNNLPVGLDTNQTDLIYGMQKRSVIKFFKKIMNVTQTFTIKEKIYLFKY